MNNKLTRRFQVPEPKESNEYKIQIYPDEYEKYIDPSKESYIEEPLYFTVNLSRLKKGYFNAEACFEGKLFTYCSRCRDKAKVNLNQIFKRAYKYSEYEQEETEDLIFYNTVYIDLFSFFLDEVSLIIPSYNLCKNDCKGVCIVCGENLNKNSCIHIKNKV